MISKKRKSMYDRESLGNIRGAACKDNTHLEKLYNQRFRQVYKIKIKPVNPQGQISSASTVCKNRIQKKLHTSDHLSTI